MTVLEKALRAPAFWRRNIATFWPDTTAESGLVSMTPEGAMRVAACMIAVTTIADQIATLAFRIVDRRTDSRQPVRPPELRALWDQPNPHQTRYDIETAELLAMLLWGASYTYLGWTRRGELAERWSIDPATVRLRMDDNTLVLSSTGLGELRNRPDARPEFAMCTLYTLPGRLDPISPVELAAGQLDLARRYQETARQLMSRGLQATHALTFGEPIDRELAEEYARRLARLHGGSGRAGGVLVVGGKDVKLQPIAMSLADAEFIAQNEHVFKLTLGIWRVPQSVAGIIDKPSAWGQGIAELSRGMEMFTLRPIARRREQALEKYITRWVAGGQYQVRYVFDSLLAASPRERVEIQRERLMSGMTSVERILEQEDEEPFRESETRYTQLGFASEEDRELQRARWRAQIVAQLVNAGVPVEQALDAAGLRLPARGGARGRPRIEDDPVARALWERADELRKEGRPLADIAAELGLSMATLQRYRRAFGQRGAASEATRPTKVTRFEYDGGRLLRTVEEWASGDHSP